MHDVGTALGKKDDWRRFHPGRTPERMYVFDDVNMQIQSSIEQERIKPRLHKSFFPFCAVQNQ
jgi:hypothetical protein